jgi:Protein of unknown function with HXXEE motif
MTAKRSVPVWLFPVAYVVHVTEEFFGGAGLSLAPHGMEGVNLTPVQFILMTCVGALLLLFGLLIAKRRGFPHLLMIMLATICLINGLRHVAATVRAGAYNPGTITSLLVLIPVGAWTLRWLWGDMSPKRYSLGVALGAGIYLAITLIAQHGRSLFG